MRHLVLAGFLFAAVAAGCSAQQLAYNSDPVTVELLAGGRSSFTFRGEAGDVIYVLVRERSLPPARSPGIAIKPPAKRYFAGWLETDGIVREAWELEQTGTHRLEVENRGDQATSYELTLFHPFSLTPTGLPPSGCVAGELRERGEIQVFTISRETPGAVRVEMAGLGEDKPSGLYTIFYGPDEFPIAEGTEGTLQPVLSAPGEYRLLVYDRGGESGLYQMCLNSPTYEPLLLGSDDQAREWRLDFPGQGTRDFWLDVRPGEEFEVELFDLTCELEAQIRHPSGEMDAVDCLPGPSGGGTMTVNQAGVHSIHLGVKCEEGGEALMVLTRTAMADEVEGGEDEEDEKRDGVLASSENLAILCGGLLGAFLAGLLYLGRPSGKRWFQELKVCGLSGFMGSLVVGFGGKATISFGVLQVEAGGLVERLGPPGAALLLGTAISYLCLVVRKRRESGKVERADPQPESVNGGRRASRSRRWPPAISCQPKRSEEKPASTSSSRGEAVELPPVPGDPNAGGGEGSQGAG